MPAFRSAHIKDIDEAFLDIIKDIFVDKSLLKKYMKTETIKPDTSRRFENILMLRQVRLQNIGFKMIEQGRHQKSERVHL